MGGRRLVDLIPLRIQGRKGLGLLPAVNLGLDTRRSPAWSLAGGGSVRSHGRSRSVNNRPASTLASGELAGQGDNAVIFLTIRDFDHYVAQQSRESGLMARCMVEQGRTCFCHQIVTHPLGSFFKMDVRRGGFLDGMPGLILSGLYAYYTFMEYAKFWEEACHAEKRG